MRLLSRKFRKRGQSSIEFMVLFGALFFFLMTFLLIVQENLADKTRENYQLTLNEIAFSVQDEIALAHSAPDGYYREFDIPEKVIRLDYDINFTPRSVYLITEDERYTVSLTVLNVTGNVQKGSNVIRRENGAVYLNTEPA